MAMMPIFPLRLVLIALPVVMIVAALLGVAAGRGAGMLKRQGAAWVITGVMIVCAIGIGYAKAPFNDPVPEPDYPLETIPPVAPASVSYVWDDAGVLSRETVRTLDERNDRLWDSYSATIGVVTCNYGGDDLGDYAFKCAEEMGLGGYDFIVVLDISGDNYWLIQGADLIRDFTDQDCSDYAYDYMESSFAQGDYDDAVLQLTERLEVWYGVYYWMS